MQPEIKYINTYVMHWRKWTWNVNLLSIKEQIQYLFNYYSLKNEKTFYDLRFTNEYKLECIIRHCHMMKTMIINI